MWICRTDEVSTRVPKESSLTFALLVPFRVVIFVCRSIWKFLVHRFPLIFLALFIAVYIYVFVHHFCFEPDQCARVFIIVYFLPLYSLSLKLNFILAF